ncbi:MAG: L,D-transpeptidase [Gammaproteobacteria bacterium]|nr:MAG: L,D-transpeptidase [Gammaproteobacteria bacterium]
MPDKPSIRVSIREQLLYLLDDAGRVIRQYPVSTSKYGTGNQLNSNKTPLGKHCIRQKIGEAAPLNEVFIGRQPQGTVASLQQQGRLLPEDIITSRILWLQGLEPGYNQGGEVDSYERYIYIHGTNEENRIGSQASHGCIRMRNQDVIELYDLVDTNCLVVIEE